MEHDGDTGGSFRRVPHVLLTAEEVRAAVALYADKPAFTIDVETYGLDPDEEDGGLNTRTNVVFWVGLGAEGLVHLIPCGHPHGVLRKAKHKAKTAAYLFYPPTDERAYTPTTRKLPMAQRKPSFRMIDHPVEATYEDPPEQLMPHEVLNLIAPLLFSDKAKVGHNVKFDLMSIAKYYGGEIPPGPYHETILQTHVLDEDRMSYDLKSMTADWFEIPHAERAAWYPKMGKAGVENFGLDEAARYLAKDVRYCWLRWEDCNYRLERKGLMGVYDFEMKLYPSIMAMEQAGFPVDVSQLEAVRETLEGQIKQIEQEAWVLAGDQFPLSNFDAKRWIMFGEGKPVVGTVMSPGPDVGKRTTVELVSQNLPVRTRTKKGEVPQVTSAVLEFYADRGNPMARLLKDWSELEKLRGTFIVGLDKFLNYHPKGLPTVHTSFKQHGTVTGRLSASTPNLQQLPREGGRHSIRSLFVADKGHRLIVADYDQIELRCAGYLSRDPEMVRVFEAGEDIHRSAAAAMFQMDPAEITSDLRQVGKTQNFAVLYGAGPDKIAAVARCSIKRAEKLIEQYFVTFAMLEKWKARELHAARKRGNRDKPWSQPPAVSIPPFGRLRRLPMLYEIDKDYIRWHAERQAINALCQGFASYVTKLAMVELHEALPQGEAWMIAQVHDEIIVRAKDSVAEEAEMILKKVMEGVADPNTGKPILGDIPLVASSSSGDSWASAKG